MSVSLHTQVGLHCLTIQVLNTRVSFIDIWYTSLTSVCYNLEHGLAIITESFSPLNLDYTTSFVKVQTRSHVVSHTIPDIFYLPCTLNWFELAWTGWLSKVDADVMHQALGLERPMVTEKFEIWQNSSWNPSPHNIQPWPITSHLLQYNDHNVMPVNQTRKYAASASTLQL